MEFDLDQFMRNMEPNLDEFTCHCDNGNNCIHLRPPTPDVTVTEAYSPTEPAYSPTEPVYSPTEPVYSPTDLSKKKTKRKHADIIDLTGEEDETPPLKARKKKDSSNFECPITCSFMADPVVDILGHTYDRSALETWLKRKLVSPLTGKNYVDVLRERKMSNSRDSKTTVRQKVIVGTNYSMIQNSVWQELSKKKIH